MNLPVNDWQFWVVTLITVGVVAVVFRNAIPGRRTRKPTRVDLTIDRGDREN